MNTKTSNSSNNSTKNGTKKRSIVSASIRSNILDVLGKTEKPVSTQEIGTAIGRAWHSIQGHCLKLQLEGRITGYKVGNMNLWVITEGPKVK